MDKQTIYFVVGLPGVGKSSHIRPILQGKDSSLLWLSTDDVRIPNKNHLEGILKIDPQNSDGFEEFSIVGFIKYHSLFSKEKNILIDTIGFEENPHFIRCLEESEPNLRLKVAFIGYSKKFQRVKYSNISNEISRSEDLRKKVEVINLPNYKFFDFIEGISNLNPIDENELHDYYEKEVVNSFFYGGI